MTTEIEKARSIYKTQSDSQLLDFAQKQGKILRPEIIPILLDELKERNIGEEISKDIEESVFLIKEEDIEILQEKIESINCPKCRKNNSRIVCSDQRTVISILIKCLPFETSTICCKKCRDHEFLLANIITLVFGWWSIAGFFLTPYSIFINFLNASEGKKPDKESITNYILNNYEELKLQENNLESYLVLKAKG